MIPLGPAPRRRARHPLRGCPRPRTAPDPLQQRGPGRPGLPGRQPRPRCRHPVGTPRDPAAGIMGRRLCKRHGTTLPGLATALQLVRHVHGHRVLRLVPLSRSPGRSSPPRPCRGPWAAVKTVRKETGPDTAASRSVGTSRAAPDPSAGDHRRSGPHRGPLAVIPQRARPDRRHGSRLGRAALPARSGRPPIPRAAGFPAVRLRGLGRVAELRPLLDRTGHRRPGEPAAPTGLTSRPGRPPERNLAPVDLSHQRHFLPVNLSHIANSARGAICGIRYLGRSGGDGVT